MLKLLNFIRDNGDWEAQLSTPPYNIKIKRSEGYIMFAYKKRANFSLDIVKECRGIILDETDNYKPVCVPFFKFDDYDEQNADEIDWSTARVQEKIDGSLIKVWHHKGVWRVSTNKSISAVSAKTNYNEKTFYNLFQKAWVKTGKKFDDLHPDYTYMFELISPHSRVVVPHTETKLYHIGTRNNNTLQELDADIGIEKPKEYKITTIEECIEVAKNLDKYQEGFVVVDSAWRRNKVKSPQYKAMHQLVNDIATEKRCLEIILYDKETELMTYFPEYTGLLNEVRERMERFIAYNEQELEKIRNVEYDSEKELAEEVNKTICPFCLFAVLKGKYDSVRDFVFDRTPHRIIEYLDKHQPEREKNLKKIKG